MERLLHSLASLIESNLDPKKLNSRKLTAEKRESVIRNLSEARSLVGRLISKWENGWSDAERDDLLRVMVKLNAAGILAPPRQDHGGRGYGSQ